MNILVLGGAGFLGSALVNRLLHDGETVSVFDRNAPTKIPEDPYKKLKWFCGDFENEAALREALKGVDLVFHLISSTTPATSSTQSVPDISKNVLPSIKLLEEMRISGTNRIVFISSGGTVYGPPTVIPISESHSTNPIVSHGIAKLTIEKYLLLYRHQYNIVPTIVRLSNPYGPTQIVKGGQGVISSMLQAAIKKGAFEIWGDGTVIRDYIYMDDVVDALHKTISYSGKEIIFNLSSSVGVSINELVDLAESVVGGGIVREYREKRTFDLDTNILDNRRIKSELSWIPKVSLEDGLKLTYEYMRKTHA